MDPPPIVGGHGEALLLDWSAYSRIVLARTRTEGGRRVDAATIASFERAVVADEITVCAPFRMEACYSVQSATELSDLLQELEAFRQVAADERTWAIAETVQRQLIATPGVSHRVPIPDLLIAALAHQYGLGVLHYDADYDLLAERTLLSFASRWIAPRGSID